MKAEISVIQALEARRAVKSFDPGHRMAEAEVRHLLEATLLSPTAFNLQHWRFVRVDDPALRREIREAAWDQPQVTDASLLLVVCADVMAWAKDPERYWHEAPEEVRQTVVPAIRGFYADRPELQRDEALRSCSLAAMTLMLVAQGMGYDSCPMDGFDFEAVGRLIGLPDDHLIAMMVAVGRANGPCWPRSGRLGLDDVLVTNRFPGVGGPQRV
jgi:nitroreductase